MILTGFLFLFAPPFLFIIITTLVLASFGKSLGIRKLYVKVLLFIFEVRNKIIWSVDKMDIVFFLSEVCPTMLKCKGEEEELYCW